jgi:hypothetical protein
MKEKNNLFASYKVPEERSQIRRWKDPDPLDRGTAPKCHVSPTLISNIQIVKDKGE